MASRIGESELRAAIDTDSSIKVDVFIHTACALTNYVESCDSDSVLNTDLLKNIELYLACHFYAHRDQSFASKATGDANATFQGQWGMSLLSTQHGQAAVTLDVSGCLAGLVQDAQRGKVRAGLTWLGKPKSDQIDYEDRD